MLTLQPSRINDMLSNLRYGNKSFSLSFKFLNFAPVMETKKALLIINPISGTGKKKGLAERVTSRLALVGINVDTKLTTGPGDATDFARQAIADGYDIVIAAGGDGTVNETAIALCGSDTALGIIPCGSGNGLARHMNIPVDVDEAVEIIAAGKSEVCDHGSANGHPFFCTFGTGFDAAVGHKFAQSKERGLMTYVKSTFKEYYSYVPDEYIIKANGETLTERAFVVAVCNASQYGNNAYIAPHASINDGLLDVTVIHYGNKLTTALVGIDLMAGSIEHNALIHTFRTHDLQIIRMSAAPVHIDGEPMVFDAEIDIHCHDARLCILTPGSHTPIRPVLTPVKAIFEDIARSVRHIFKK